MAEPREYPDGIPGSREGAPAEVPAAHQPAPPGESIYRPLDGSPPRWPAFQPGAPQRGSAAPGGERPAAAGSAGHAATPSPSAAAPGRRELVLAGWGARLAAVIVDNLLALLAVLCVTVPAGVALGLTVPEAFAFFGAFQVPETIADMTALYALFAAQAAAQPGLIAWLLVRGRGQTPGKRLMRVRVVRADGTPPSWVVAVRREVLFKTVLVGILSSFTVGLVFLLNYLWPLWDKERRAGHDLLAKTRVIEAEPRGEA